MSLDLVSEARRQVEICNACRYCEGYCAVFPAITRQRIFAEGDLTQLANLCHNCRGCFYACQYTEPHEFALNLPKALAELRHKSWKDHAWPRGFAHLFDKSGMAITAFLVVSISLLFWIAQSLRPDSGEGFYAYMSHGLMVAIFAPAFLLPLGALGLSLKGYWRSVGGGWLTFAALSDAMHAAAGMRNLAGGHGKGCNFEEEDRPSNARRWAHQATLFGFMLCFASTSAGTVLHYGFGLEAPYGFWSLPKLLGVPGGVLLCIGTAWLAYLKTQADPRLGAPNVWGGEMAFVLLLGAVSATGLALYAASGSGAVAWLLPIHLGTVLAFFLLTPYSKMAHGFYRMAALLADATKRGA
ncbi:MAG: tricarballylate utilization 4Fe-4S protein TcuB [Pseudomonadota bacterium]